ncbi:hypothetical protein DXG01_004720 [Tephrocybe rancida]|nr:hypothetical protein DXG01_004720 [Tephrocybe rancida]
MTKLTSGFQMQVPIQATDHSGQATPLTARYNHVERGGYNGHDVWMTDANGTFLTGGLDSPDTQADIEQIGGGSCYSLRPNISLTPKAKHYNTTVLVAQQRMDMFPISPTPALSRDLHPDLIGLDSQALKNLSHDYSSDFEDLTNEFEGEGMPADPALAHDPDDSFVMDDPSATDISPPPTEFEQLIQAGNFQKLMEDGDFQPLHLPSGHRCSASPSRTQPPTPSTPVNTPEKMPDSAIFENHPGDNSDNLLGDFPCAELPIPSSSTPTPVSTPSRRGCLSAAAIQSMADAYAAVDEILFRVSNEVNRSIGAVRKCYMANFSDSRKSGAWNLYERYFAIFREEEVTRSGIDDGTFREYFDNFMAQYDEEGAVNYMRAALDLNKLMGKKETLGKRAQTFKNHVKRVVAINKEGTLNRYHSLTILSGECMHEDAGLWALVATLGLENYAKSALGLDDDTLVVVF